VVIPDVFPQAELAALDAVLDRIIEERSYARASEKGAGNGWILQLGLASEHTRDFAQDERLLGLIEDLVKPGIAIYSAKLATKLPHSDEICHWHQDDAYYRANSESACRCSVWVPLQDADERNGCLWLVPGSHRRGLQSYHHEDHGMCRLAMDLDKVDLSGAVPCPAAAGSVVVFSALTWHASKGNRTDQIRRAFIVSYQEATATAGNGAQWKILRPAP
jgi:ectoine hydroxylase-related dioxygenase (phytanoyl-CoA dioxygenase family)